MNIHDQLKEVGQFFKTALIEGDFEFVSCTERVASIKIHGYDFNIWISNTIKDSLDFYFGVLPEDFPVFSENMMLTTQKERLAAWKHLNPHVEKYKNNELRDQKQKQLERLQKELEELTFIGD